MLEYDIRKDTISGVPRAVAMGMLEALFSRGIKDVETLKNSLKSTEDRLNVVDKGNKDRVLGTFGKPMLPRGYFFSVAVQEPGSFQWGLYDNPPITSTVQTVTFEAVVWNNHDKLEAGFALATSSPLQKLMCVPDFRLPGETEVEARERRYRR